MPTIQVQNRTFDARPDRVDYRDRLYNPPLLSLLPQYPTPEFIAEHLAHYTNSGLILDQGQEGACTGFGLATVINYLFWFRSLTTGDPIESVSPRMLYQMARLYDEWPGEDYEGSSCRGAMKGWHHHGVCSETLWPYHNQETDWVQPSSGWEQDAAQRPLGVYYRINKDAIVDMQAAIQEVRAIYCSAMVHEGWFLAPAEDIPTIQPTSRQTGGHAFAIVGYTPDGFIVQNSWGPDWGFGGFAILTYQDWIEHGSDAWVAVMGAPMAVQFVPRTRSRLSLEDIAVGKATRLVRASSATAVVELRNPAVQPLSESQAYEHSVVLGNNGRPLNRFLDVENAPRAVQEVVLNLPQQWLEQRERPKLAIYAHGGLNDEEGSIRRIRVMAPYFSANDIYPVFITWRTGVLESLVGIVGDVVERFFTPELAERDRGWLSDVRNHIQEAKDRSIEVASENLLVKAVWTQMKQNAEAAIGKQAGLSLIMEHLTTLKREIPRLEVHLVGHSAGAILLGYLLDQLAGSRLKVETLSLYAPACTVGFAVEHYVAAFHKNILRKSYMHFDILSDERERADSVGPYGKSLLYFVSRALESVHKMPLLGMEGVWRASGAVPDMWNESPQIEQALKAWQTFATRSLSLRVHDQDRAQVHDGQGVIPLAHGSFDNDVEVITETLTRIRGGVALDAAVENLRGF
jgi:hypothetical protein